MQTKPLHRNNALSIPCTTPPGYDLSYNGGVFYLNQCAVSFTPVELTNIKTAARIIRGAKLLATLDAKIQAHNTARIDLTPLAYSCAKLLASRHDVLL